MDQINLLLLYVASTFKIHTCFRKVICSPHKLTEERRREAKRQEQRKSKSISGECQISWVGIPQNRNKWEARRLELRAGSDQMSLPFGLHCISSFHSSLPTLTLLWAPRGWPICPRASGQRKSLVGDEKRRKQGQSICSPDFLTVILHLLKVSVTGLHTASMSWLGSDNFPYLFRPSGNNRTKQYQHYPLWFPYTLPPLL